LRVVKRRGNICNKGGYSQFGGVALLGFYAWKLERPGSSSFLSLAGVSLPQTGVQLVDQVCKIANWSASSQIALTICYMLFSIFVSNVCFVFPDWPLIRRRYLMIFLIPNILPNLLQK